MRQALFRYLIPSAVLMAITTGILFSGPDVRSDEHNEKNQPVEGFIYFADADRIYLKSEKKMFAAGLDDHQLAVKIIEALIQGPLSGGLASVWPKETRLNALYITEDKKAYVDLDLSPDMVMHMDTRSELLAVYAMTNSLTVNIQKIESVKILIKGQDAITLAGHIDLDHFYKTNMLIVK